MAELNQNTNYAFYFDASRCNGCKGCQVACKDGRSLSLDRHFRRVYEYAGGTFSQSADGVMHQSAFAYYLSVSCNHCDEPACTKACPTGAMHKRTDGLVAIHSDICIGCASCAEACPYDAPQLEVSQQVMTKCDGCSERLAYNLPPLCVQACSQRALDFGRVSDLQAKYGGLVGASHCAPLPSPSQTKPNLLIRLSPNHQPVGSSAGKVINIREL